MTGTDLDEPPVIGEPLAVELANTSYGTGAGRIDFLATPGRLARWLAATGAGTGSVTAAGTRAGEPDERVVRAVRRLRDAVHALVTAAVDGAPPPTAALAEVNRCAGRAPRLLRLAEAPGGALVIRATVQGDGLDALLGRLAQEAVLLLGGPDAGRLRRCARPDCTIAFVQRHRRRRWCHESCGHRLRQARYQRRRTGPGRGDRLAVAP